MVIKNKYESNNDDSRDKYYNGCFLMDAYDSVLKEIKHLEVYDSDVWVTSFPKSGKLSHIIIFFI